MDLKDLADKYRCEVSYSEGLLIVRNPRNRIEIAKAIEADEKKVRSEVKRMVERIPDR